MHMLRSSVTSALLLLTVGCSGRSTLHADDSQTEPVERDARFIADWQVSSSQGWALLATISVYRLLPTGEIEVVFHEEGDYFEGEAGKFYDGATGLECEFGNQWWSEGSTRLLIESECDDGSVVNAALDFLKPESLNATFPEPVVSAPEGSVGYWEKLQGSFRRCTAAPEDCSPLH